MPTARTSAGSPTSSATTAGASSRPTAKRSSPPPEAGPGLERVPLPPEFDGFPMFSHDGKKLVWASNRNQRQRGDTNIFLADWVEEPTPDPATPAAEAPPAKVVIPGGTHLPLVLQNTASPKTPQ